MNRRLLVRKLVRTYKFAAGSTNTGWSAILLEISAYPFQTVELPEIIEEYLDHGVSRCVAFNRRGTLLASGCADGRIVIWDFESRGVALTLEGHSKAVSSLAWSRDGRYLVSASLDQTVVSWEVLRGVKEHVMTFDNAVVKISIDVRRPTLCVASFAIGLPQLFDFATSAPPRQLQSVVIEGEGKASKAATSSPHGTCTALFNNAGTLIYVGHGRGTIAVLDAASLRFVDVVRVQNSPRILDLTMNRKGTHLLVSCYDRIIRMYEARDAQQRRKSYSMNDIKAKIDSLKGGARRGSAVSDEPLLVFQREFQNAVERMQWKSVTFTADSEHVVGASAAKNEHNVYIWSRVYGNFERMLEGPKEGILEVLWHPVRSILLSVSSTGRIYLWAKVYRENWSAFAPDFEELEENQEYVEREDEFDVNPRADEQAAAANAAEEAEPEVDIVNGDDARAFSSDDEGDERAVHYLPVVIQAHQANPEPPRLTLDDGIDAIHMNGAAGNSSNDADSMGADSLGAHSLGAGSSDQGPQDSDDGDAGAGWARPGKSRLRASSVDDDSAGTASHTRARQRK